MKSCKGCPKSEVVHTFTGILGYTGAGFYLVCNGEKVLSFNKWLKSKIDFRTPHWCQFPEENRNEQQKPL